MAAPKQNKNAVGNKGGKGRASLYKPEYAHQAQKLCAMAGFTDQRLAEFFGVNEATINRWKLAHVEFAQALCAGKAETDDLVERATVAHITGYHVDTEKATRNGKVIVREWVKGDANSGMKWLASEASRGLPRAETRQAPAHHGRSFSAVSRSDGRAGEARECQECPADRARGGCRGRTACVPAGQRQAAK